MESLHTKKPLETVAKICGLAISNMCKALSHISIFMKPNVIFGLFDIHNSKN